MSQGLIFFENLMHNPICSICLHEIDDPVHRIAIFQDKEKNPIIKRFHYFFPCWDMQQIAENYLDYKIEKLGFSCEKSILQNTKELRNLQNNFTLWI